MASTGLLGFALVQPIYQLHPAILEAYVDVYELTCKDLILIKLGDEALLISDGQAWMPLSAESETQFFAEVDNSQVLFVVNAAGRTSRPFQ